MAMTEDTILDDLLGYLDASPSPYHAVASSAQRLTHGGFVERAEDQVWTGGVGRWFVRRGGTLVAWAVRDDQAATSGFRIVGAHTDSPNLRLKPRAGTDNVGYRQLGVEVYGGALLNSWLDRDLGLSGRLVVRTPGGLETSLVHIAAPVARVPQLAIHLDREISTKGLLLNAQQHMAPIVGVGSWRHEDLLDMLGAELGVDPSAILEHDLMLHDVTPARVGGVDDELLASGRIDNLLSCHSATMALGEAAEGVGPPIPLVCLFDHEEVGSVSASGAGSSILPTVLERIVHSLDGGRPELGVALARSTCVSADGAHATHPNYADRHDPDHVVELDGGPVIKHNANERYATDARSGARFALACEEAGVPSQRFVNRSDLPCGSTIGPITAARLGIPTVDAGVAQLAMHSARETCGTADPARFAAALTVFLVQP